MNTAPLSPILAAFIRSVFWFAGAYLLGSIPVAWLLTKLTARQDLRRMGSGNVGVMNTALSVARWAGLVVFLTEIAKGVLAVTIPRLLGAQEAVIGLCLVGAVIGTRWPVWLGFKGGRGNTTGLSGFGLLSIYSLLSVAILWVVARLLMRNSFRATRLTLIGLPVITWFITRSWWLALTGIALSLIYLNAQDPTSDDHLQINRRWDSFWDFLTSPPRR